MLSALASALLAGCPPSPPAEGPVFNNTTDPTNNGATYIGSAACAACHPDIQALTALHGHTYILNRVAGAPPAFPTAATRAGVPDPPNGTTWNDISYMIGGYTKYALFISSAGFVFTDGVEGVETQWNLESPANGTTAGFVSFDPDQTAPLPYAYDCFRCHATGPQAPGHQDGRPGIRGTWAEPGVRCEACHGPGSNHLPRPAARAIYVDSSAALCGRCHTRGDDPNVILAADGFVQAYTQTAELRASGGHAAFACGTCHDPHTSITYDRARGLRNDCPVCHTDHGLPAHEGITYERDVYTEPLSCVSCHMPFATRTASSASATVAGDTGRIGDTRTHIFRIDVRPVDQTAFFTADQTQVARDADGRAAVTLDFVCLRCHNNGSAANNAFPLDLDLASQIATDMHSKFDR